MQYDYEEPWKSLRFKRGDKVDIVQGVDAGRNGEIIAIYPASARPYLVKIREGWYVHFAEDRLAIASHVDE